jgi:putative ABC transport system permease protein
MSWIGGSWIGPGLLADAARDARHALRALGRSPGFAAVAILTLGLGIGAATAIASIVDTILLQPLPFPDSDRLVRIVEYAPPFQPGRPPYQRGLTHQEFLDWRSRARSFDDATAVIPMAQRMVATPQGAAGLWGAAAAENVFELLRVDAAIGRTLARGDEANPDVAVLSHDTWRLHFASDPGIVGRTIELRTGALMAPIPPRLLTVVGVLPADFEFPTGPIDFYTPVALDPKRPSPQVTTIARLAPGVSMADATAEVNALGAATRPPWPAAAPPLAGPRFEIQGLKEQAVRAMQPALRLLLAAVAAVLLIVCANVANLLMARGTVRRREVAVRLAIGATRGRLARQILAECAVLTVAGGALGAAIGVGGILIIKQMTTLDAPGIFRLMFGATILPRGHEVGVDLRVFAIAFGIAAITSVCVGILPALRLSRGSALQAVSGRGGASGRRDSRMRGALVVAQLGLATTLLVGAGLLAHSFVRLATFDKGYRPSGVLAFNLLLPDRYPVARKAETIAAVLTELRDTAGVRAAGFARHGLLIGEELFVGVFVPPGRSLEEMRSQRVRVRSVSDGYLTAMGVPLVEGRDLGPGDAANAPPVLVMNRSAARQFFGAERAVGQVIDWHLAKSQATLTVAGVVEDMRQRTATEELRPEIFVDYRQLMRYQEAAGDNSQRQNEIAIGFLSFAVRTSGPPPAAIPRVREIVRSLDPAIGIDAILPMTDLEASAVARERFYATVLGLFAGVAGLLAAIGVSGVVAYTVAQRTREIGIRIAIGAGRAQVLGLVLRQGVVLTATGVALGLIGAAAAAHLLQSMLFGIGPLDAATFVTVPLGFVLLGLLASYVPARRATAVDPVAALRIE